MIDESDVETLVWRDETPTQNHSAVRLTHKPTGIVVESWKHDTQIANREAAMRELERRVGEAGHSPSFSARVRRWLGRFAKPS